MPLNLLKKFWKKPESTTKSLKSNLVSTVKIIDNSYSITRSNSHLFFERLPCTDTIFWKGNVITKFGIVSVYSRSSADSSVTELCFVYLNKEYRRIIEAFFDKPTLVSLSEGFVQSVIDITENNLEYDKLKRLEKVCKGYLDEYGIITVSDVWQNDAAIADSLDLIYAIVDILGEEE